MSATQQTKKATVTTTTTQINDVVAKYRKAQRNQVRAAEELIEVLGPAVSGQAKVVKPPSERILKLLNRIQAKVAARIAKYLPVKPA